MPKTFTDDIAPALPSALDGPLQIVDPSDSDSHLTIDPANARIQAAGNARPVRRRMIETSRNSGFAGTATIGTALDARAITASADTGSYLVPIRIPADMDTAEPSSVKLLLAPAGSGGDGTVVRLELVASFGKDGDTSVTDTTIIHDWTVPTGWTNEDLKQVLIDAGSGYTFAANVFESSDVLGLRIRRLGSAAQDTYPNTILLVTALVFEYTAKDI